MPKLRWNADKNVWLKKHRRVSFEDVAAALDTHTVYAIRAHPNSFKYPSQKIIYFEKDNYAYACPYITELDGTLFLKTIYPSRKAVKKYLKGK